MKEVALACRVKNNKILKFLQTELKNQLQQTFQRLKRLERDNCKRVGDHGYGYHGLRDGLQFSASAQKVGMQQHINLDISQEIDLREDIQLEYNQLIDEEPEGLLSFFEKKQWKKKMAQLRSALYAPGERKKFQHVSISLKKMNGKDDVSCTVRLSETKELYDSNGSEQRTETSSEYKFLNGRELPEGREK